MLSMDDIKYIRRMYEIEGVSIREIMRRTGYHYKTIKKYLEMQDFNESHYTARDSISLLDPLKPIVDEWLENDLKMPRKQRHTAKRVYDRLIDEYPKMINIKLRTVQYYVAKKKKELNTEKPTGYLPLEHFAGEAQVDFGKFSYFDNSESLQKGLNLTVSFPYSNAAYCQIFHGENAECLLQGIKNTIEYMGVVPYRMVFDNLSAAVAHIGRGKNRKLTDKFKKFIEHYGIEADFCNPASGWEKGNVENKVGYERRNMFVPIPTILSFSQFNIDLFNQSQKDMNREHYAKKCLIQELFEIDKLAMLPLNPIPFHVSRFEKVKADKYGKVRLDTNTYSTSPKMARESVYLEITSDLVTVMDKKYKTIVTHPRLYGKGKESMKWMPYIKLMANRPNALKYTEFYQQLPTIWQQYLINLDNSERRKALLTLNTILENHDIRVASDVLNSTLTNGVKDADSILTTYYRLTNQIYCPKPMKLSKDIIKMPSFQVDNTRYDSLLVKGETM